MPEKGKQTMRKVLITGVCGLIGSHLADSLLNMGNCKVIGIDNLKAGILDNIKLSLKNKNFSFVKADILDFIMLRKIVKDCEIIVHLAAEKKIGESGNAHNIFQTNVFGTHNIFEVAKIQNAKVIFASTSDVYGVSSDLPLKEGGNLVIGAPTAKRWAYAGSKIVGEQMAFAYYKEFKVPMVILRYFGCFSPRSSFSWSGGHIPLFIDDILNNRPVIIHGDGKQTRSMGYVEDIVNGTILAMYNPGAVGEIFNIGNDEEISVIDSAYLIHGIANTGKKLRINLVPYERLFGSYTDTMRRVPDLKKAKSKLGYLPKVRLSDGIKLTIEERRKINS